MNTVQLDMLMDYLNEGTGVDRLSWMVECIVAESEEFNNNEFIVSIDESFSEKAKEALGNIWKFIKGIVTKVMEFVSEINKRLVDFIRKAKEKLKEKKASTNEAVILESATVKVPYYWIKTSIGESESKIGQLSTIANSITDDEMYKAMVDAARFTLSLDDEIFEDSLKAAEEAIINLDNIEFEVRFKEESVTGDPIDTKIKYADLLKNDAKVLEKSIKDADAQYNKVKEMLERPKDIDQEKLNKYLVYLRKTIKPTSDYATMQMRLINSVAAKYLTMKD